MIFASFLSMLCLPYHTIFFSVLTFGSYEIYKKKLLEKFPETSPSVLYAFAAVLGDITGSGWLCPSEVVKQQLQGGMYTSTREALSAIWSQKGIGGFYQGYIGGLARDVPFRVCQLTSFEVTKNSYLRLKRKRSGMSEGAELTLSAAESAYTACWSEPPSKTRSNVNARIPFDGSAHHTSETELDSTPGCAPCVTARSVPPPAPITVPTMA